MNNDCVYCRELITLAEWLDEEEKTMLANHVQTCPRCKADLDLMTDLAETLSPDALPAPAADLTDRIMAGVRQDTVPARTPRLTTVLLLVLSGQLLGLYFFLDDVIAFGAQLVPLAEQLWTEILTPLAVGWQSSFTGLFDLPEMVDLPDLTYLALPCVATLLFLCLFAGRIFYTEERNHASIAH